ncbi:glycosyltransferase family 4 protein [bacterium]|nr:glycosyltransferase family 4 protein [Rubripirellula sp.]MDB4494448.1 glycosyltransferase family 4 protein [Pseudomonadales bacterium]MDB4654489.1 glycosyltransferase family 4 protein [Rubripirellula sp.]MDC0287887.1 glycosyltransferase family 4 protein [Rubripirellula sp.]MDC0317737.1 glycosyltransferase family 4 protein [bacterium]
MSKKVNEVAPSRVLMLLENNSFPEDRRVALEAQSLVEAGFVVTVICPTGFSRRWSDQAVGAKVYRYPVTWESSGFVGYLWEYVYSLCMISLFSLYVLIRHGFDVVHVHTPPDLTGLIGVFYKLFGKKFVFDHHDLSPELYLARRASDAPNFVYRVLLYVERFVVRRADKVISTNETQRTVHLKRCGVEPKRCVVVRNGPSDRFLGKVNAVDDPARHDKLVLGFVGVIGVQDGVDYMVRAVYDLKFNCGRKDFIAVIVGDGSALPDLRRLAEELDVLDEIVFTGALAFSAVPMQVASFDICLTPDPSNAYNDSCTTVKTMEYMSLCKPTVCFQTHENIVTAGDAALYADRNDVGSFVKQMLKLMDDPELRIELGTRARRRIDGGLTWKHQARLLIAMYRDLLDSPVTTGTSST